MHTVTAVPHKNRLIIMLSGTIPTSEASDIMPTLLREVNKLKRGFDVITDLRKFDLGESDAASLLQNGMHFLHARGVGRVVRVVGTSRNGLIQFIENTKLARVYEAAYVRSMEEAQAMLDRPPRS